MFPIELTRENRSLVEIIWQFVSQRKGFVVRKQMIGRWLFAVPNQPVPTKTFSNICWAKSPFYSKFAVLSPDRCTSSKDKITCVGVGFSATYRYTYGRTALFLIAVFICFFQRWFLIWPFIIKDSKKITCFFFSV